MTNQFSDNEYWFQRMVQEYKDKPPGVSTMRKCMSPNDVIAQKQKPETATKVAASDLEAFLTSIISRYQNPMDMNITYPDVLDSSGQVIGKQSLLIINGDRYLFEVTE